MQKINHIEWHGELQGGELRLLDQRRLPLEIHLVPCPDLESVAEAISSMIVRGAPAIGITAAYGVVLGARDACVNGEMTPEAFESLLARLASTRPTAVNLFWALGRMRETWTSSRDQATEARLTGLLKEAKAIHEEDIAMNLRMGEHGASLLEESAKILTHCNAGALATGGHGTAVGVIRSLAARARAKGAPLPRVWVDETRPYLQGARLTAWELVQAEIPATLISDNMAGHFMSLGEVDAVIIGADRIAANGDVANKIGSYALAVLAKHHDIPFYVAAPSSTLDPATPSGAQIEIEERSAEEVTTLAGTRIAPEEVEVRHPAFDVTPNALITAIITEEGVFRAPFEFGQRKP